MDAKEQGDKVTVEQVKAVLAAYQRDNFPQGKWASAMFDTGVDGCPETLTVIPTRPSSDQTEP